MHILLISTQDYIHHPVPSRHHYIFEELAKRHDVHVLHFHVSDSEGRKTNLNVHEATIFPVKNPAIHYLINAPYHFYVIGKVLEKEDIDVVVASHILAGYAAVKNAKKRGIPVIFDLKDWYPDSAAVYYKNKLIKKILYSSVLYITLTNLRESDVVTTVSPSLVEVLRTFEINPILITNGVDTSIFRPLSVAKGKRVLGYDEDDFVIGYVGSIERWIDLETVLYAVKKLRDSGIDVKLSIIGKRLFTDYEDEIQSLVRKLELEGCVKFHGFVPYNMLPKYIAGMDVCLIPFRRSPVSDVALPNKFFEYTACGKIILSTPLPDVIKINPGNVFFYSTSDELCNIIKQLLNIDYKELVKKIFLKINLYDYDWRTKAKEFEKIMFSLIK